MTGPPSGSGSTDPRRRHDVGLAFAFTSAVCFATVAILAKFAYDEGAEPIALLAVRFAVATVLLMAFAWITGKSLAVGRSTILKLLALGGFGYAFEASLFFAALERAPAGVVSLIFYSYPLWTNIIGLALGLERLRPALAAALAVGSAGVVLIFSVPIGGLEGPLLALGAAVAVAVYYVAAEFVAGDVDSAAAATWTAAGAAIALTIAGSLLRPELPAAALGHTVTMGIVTAAAFVLLYAALTRIGSARSSIATMVEPVATVVLAAALLGEDLTLRVLAGAALVISTLPILARATRHEIPAADSL